MPFETTLDQLADLIMGQSPAGEDCNLDGKGLPLLNGPTEFGSRHPFPVQYTLAGNKYAELGDILFCVRGSTTGRMNYADQKYVIGRGIAAIRGKNGYPTSYIRALLDQHLNQLLASATGSTFPNVSRDTLLKQTVLALLHEDATCIAGVFEHIDDKIELNRQINQTLEQMAKALFQSWFVDFEPVKAKLAAIAEGRDPLRAAMSSLSGKTEGELDEMAQAQFDSLAATAALFPEEMEQSVLGEVPKGWEVSQFGAVVELAYGKALPKTQHRVGTVPVYGSGGIGGFHDAALVAGPGIVVGRKGTVGSVFLVHTDFCAIDTVFYVKLLQPIPLYWVYEQLRRLDIASLGADSAVPGVNRNSVYMQQIVVPPAELLNRYQEIVQPFVTSLKVQSDQSSTLASLRDLLLPKLLSGELAVGAKDAPRPNNGEPDEDKKD